MVHLLSGLLFSSLVAASPLQLSKRGNSCDLFATYRTSEIEVQANAWGYDQGVGGQCTDFVSGTGNKVSWTSTWSWSENEYKVKGFPNAVVHPHPKQLSQLSAIETAWQYSYRGQHCKANVAYDIFVTDVPGGPNTYEIMVWLGAYNEAGPLKDNYTAPPLARVTIAGKPYDLWRGGEGRGMTTFSFVAADAAKTEGSYRGDLVQFIRYLTHHQGLPERHYLASIGAGTETFLGSKCTFTTHAYTIDGHQA